MMSGGDVLFDDTKIKSLNWLIDNAMNEFIEFTFRISEPIAVENDAINFPLEI